MTKEDDSGPGTLRSAIAQAIAGGRIPFADGVETITLSSEPVIDKSLTIMGLEGDSVTLGGNGVTPVIYVDRDASDGRAS